MGTTKKDELVQMSVRFSPAFWREISDELRERGEIDFAAFAKIAIANELRRGKNLRAMEDAAVYGAASTPKKEAVYPQEAHSNHPKKTGT